MPSTHSPSILVILGSVRDGRRTDKVSAWVNTYLSTRQDMTFTQADVKTIDLPMYAYPASPEDGDVAYTDQKEHAWRAQVNAADGFLMLTPEYNHGYPPGLKNMIDYLYAQWNNKPVAFVSYGGISGGIRAVEQLRQVAVEMQLVPISSGVHIQYVGKAFTDDGKPTNEQLNLRLAKTIDQLVWWANVLHYARTHTEEFKGIHPTQHA